MIKPLLRSVLRQYYPSAIQLYTKWKSIRPTNKVIQSRLASQDPIYLEIGAGAKKGVNGWITADITKGADIWMDLLKPFPWPDNSITKIYSSHVFEHFYTHDLETILRECKRVLKPDGVISVCVPNASLFINGYLNSDSFDPNKYCSYKPGYNFYSKIDYINYVAYLGGEHHHLFDQENLVELLAKNGFRNSRSRGFDSELDLAARDYQSIYAEAEK